MKNGHYVFYSVMTVLIGILFAMSIVAGLQWGSRHMSRDVSVYPEIGTTAEGNQSQDNPANIDTNAQALSEEGVGGTSIGSLTSTITRHKSPPPISATQYIVETLGGVSPYSKKFIAGTSVINQKDADRSVPIASLTKLVTAVVASNVLNQQTIINIGPKVLSTYAGNTARLENGEELTAGDLLYPLLMTSSNDAAEALALAYGKKKFVQAMNDWAYSIGAYHTYFAEPTGLSPQNISSASDMFLILSWIYKNRPDILAMTLTKVKTLGFHTWVNPAHFLNLTAYAGGKDGYIPEAGLTSAALFAITVHGNRELVAVVVLGSTNRDADVLGLLDRIGSDTIQ